MTVRYIDAMHKALQFVEETTFEVDPTSGYGTLRMAHNISWDPGLTVIPVEPQKSVGMRGPDASAIGGKGGTLTFDIYVQTETDDAADFIKLAKRMGAQVKSVAQKTGLVTGGAAANITLLDADAADIQVGMALLHNAAAADDSIRFVTDISSAAGTTTVSVNANWAGTPSSGDSIEAMDTITPKSGQPDKTFTFHLYEGADSTNRIRWELLGCTGTWVVPPVQVGGLIVASVEISVSEWTYSSNNTAQAAFAGNAPHTPICGLVHMAGSTLNTSEVGFDPGFEVVEIPALKEGSAGDQGRQGWNFRNSRPKITFKPLHDQDHIARLTGATIFDWQYSQIVSVTDAIAFWQPATQIISLNEEEGPGGFNRPTMEMIAKDPGYSVTDGDPIPLWAFALSNNT